MAKSAKPYEVICTWKTIRTDNKPVLTLDYHNFMDNYVLLFFFSVKANVLYTSLSKTIPVKRLRNQIYSVLGKKKTL